MKKYVLRRVVSALCTAGLLGLSTQAGAAAFQLWEQDGGSYFANYHAGYAAAATDANTAFYNPAGITRFKNQQLALNAVNVITNFKFTGAVSTSGLNAGRTWFPVVAQAGTYALVPSFNYVAPITDKIGFGFGVVVPFGLKTNYGTSTYARYIATETSVRVVNISPSLGFQVTNGLSLGAGLDIQRMNAEFNTVATFGSPALDTLSTNKADDTAYGYHLGALYEFSPCTRVGLSYHSQVVHHLNGSSRFDGPLADPEALAEGRLDNVLTSHASTRATLPAYTNLSIYQKVAPPVALLANIGYTQWNVFKEIHLEGVSAIEPGPLGFQQTTSLEVFIPQNYHNSWTFSVGTEYTPCDRIILRAGLGYDQSPVREAYRDLRLPDTDRYVVALGGHYQATKAVGVDVGWLHVFVNKVTVNPVPQVMGISVGRTDGKATGGADVYGAQLTWDIC